MRAEEKGQEKLVNIMYTWLVLPIFTADQGTLFTMQANTETSDYVHTLRIDNI